MDSIETVVVGAGVVGLAIARALARSGREVLILEAADGIGTETSARNSEVIHAGIYYPPGSLKAALCVEGRRRLIEYAEGHGIDYRLCGKLIVAQDASEVAGLERIEARALACGVSSLQWLTGAEAKAREPALTCYRALRSPGTGIIDSHAFMLSLLGEAEDAGAVLALRSRLRGGTVCADGSIRLRISSGRSGERVSGEAGTLDAITLACRELVNSAGLGAWEVARCLDGYPESLVPERHLAKGSYFALSGRSPFGSLIYPIPSEAGLGTHLTLDLGGQARFGPDVEWIDRVDYSVDSERALAFYADIRRYWPGLPEGALLPGYAGVRPKVVGPGAAAGDFIIRGPDDIGAPGQVHLFGIESPGLTASLAIAERVRELLDAPRR